MIHGFNQGGQRAIARIKIKIKMEDMYAST